jgi:Ca2+-binding RTX toxin-like protein
MTPCASLDLIDVVGCTQTDPHEAICDAQDLTALDIGAYGGDDTVVSTADGPLPLRVWIRGGEGGDVLSGGAGGEWIEGDEGDELVTGGGGEDVLEGGPGADILRGGDGDDRIFATENDVPPPVLRVDLDDAVASARTATVTGDATYVPPTPGRTRTISVPTPRTPGQTPNPFTPRVVVTDAMLADRALGAHSALMAGTRHAVFSAYVPAARGTTVRVGARAVVGLALVSKRDIAARIEQVLELTRRGSAKPRRVRA